MAPNCLAKAILASIFLDIFAFSCLIWVVSTRIAVKSPRNAPAMRAAVRITLALVGDGDRQTSTCSPV